MTINITELIIYEQENSFLDFKAVEYKSGTNAELVKERPVNADAYLTLKQEIIRKAYLLRQQ